MPEETQNQSPDAPAGASNPAATPLGQVGQLLKVGLSPGKGLSGLAFKVGGKKIIIPGMIIATLFFIAIFFLATSLAAYASRLGALPGYGGTCGGTGNSASGVPPNADTNWRTDIQTTTFAGCDEKTGGCADSGDPCYAGGSGIKTDCSGPTQYFASLPYTIASQCKGDISNCARIEVSNPKSGSSIVLAVVDAGPCNVTDSEYVLHGAEPKVYRGAEQGGCSGQKGRKAALDISPTAMKFLGSPSITNWRFTSQGLAEAASCIPANGFTTVNRAQLSSWYYNQGQAPWGNKAGQCSGWSVNIYRSRACALTSGAMIARYYGKNITPYDVGQAMCDQRHSILLDFGVLTKIIDRNIKYSKSNPSVDDLKKALSYGPVLAQGVKAFGAKGQHWVVIVGVEGDNFITNNPSATSQGGSGKIYSLDDFKSGRVKNIYAY